MTRLAAGIESLDDKHAAAAARARVRERLCRIGLARLLSFCRSIGCSLLGRRRVQVQELTHVRDGVGTIAAGEQAVMADAVEALGQDVDEEVSILIATGGAVGR
jgi:hypothetical protein